MSLSRNKRRGSGLILVTAMWLIMTVAVFAIGLSRVTYAGYSFVKLITAKSIARHSIDAVVLRTKYERMIADKEEQISPVEFFSEKEYISGPCRIAYAVTDEQSRININRAQPFVLEKLPEMDMDKVIDMNTSGHKPFLFKERLLRVDEIEQEDFEAMREMITVYGNGRVNINTCSMETLDILGLDTAAAKAVMEYRAGEDGQLGTLDDNYFESKGKILPSLRKEGMFSLRDEQAIVSFLSKNLIAVGSDVFRIDADVYLNKRVIDRYSIVLGKDGGKYRVREWRQH